MALLMAAPALVTASWLAWTELVRGQETSPTADLSFIEALREDRFERAYRYIHSGQDPNAPVLFQDDLLTGGDELPLTPLIIAVALDRGDSVKMLMSSGAVLDAPGNGLAVCLARRLGYAGMAESMVRDGGTAAVQARCPQAPHAEAAPLRAYVD